MYAAKRAGKGQIAMYDPSMVLPEAADLHYRPLLIEAMKAGAIECVFQPIIDLRHRSGAFDGGAGPVAGRRRDGRRRTISSSSPAGWGCCPTLTDLMLDRACANSPTGRRRCGRADLRVGVNVPRRPDDRSGLPAAGGGGPAAPRARRRTG